jgi:hypothetical protein
MVKQPYGTTNLGFSKVVFGPPQTSPGRYTITKELIDSGNDLKLTYKIRSFDKREGYYPGKLNNEEAAVYLDRYPDKQTAYSAYRNANGYYSATELASARSPLATIWKTKCTTK